MHHLLIAPAHTPAASGSMPAQPASRDTVQQPRRAHGSSYQTRRLQCWSSWLACIPPSSVLTRGDLPVESNLERVWRHVVQPSRHYLVPVTCAARGQCRCGICRQQLLFKPPPFQGGAPVHFQQWRASFAVQCTCFAPSAVCLRVGQRFTVVATARSPVGAGAGGVSIVFMAAHHRAANLACQLGQ